MRDCRCFGNEILIISGAAIGLMIYLFFFADADEVVMSAI